MDLEMLLLSSRCKFRKFLISFVSGIVITIIIVACLIVSNAFIILAIADETEY